MVPESTVGYVLGAYPEACRVPDDGGRLPLHALCTDQSEHLATPASAAADSALLNALAGAEGAEDAVRHRDGRGHSPLDVLAHHKRLDVATLVDLLGETVWARPPRTSVQNYM